MFQMQVTEFWAEVNQEAKRIETSIAKGEVAPAGEGAVYIVSLKVRRSAGKPGIISEADVKRAAQTIVEGTHELASAEQIAAYLEETKRRQEIVRAGATRGRNVMNFVPPVNEGGR